MYFRLALGLLFGALTAVEGGEFWKGQYTPRGELEEKVATKDPEALVEWAFCSMRSENGVVYRDKMIFERFQQAAEAGNDLGKAGLAHCYLDGVGAAWAPDEAFKLATEAAAARADHPVTIGALARCIYEGGGTKKNDARSIKLWNRAAEAGSIYGLHGLARSHYYGRGVKKNTEEGIRRWTALMKGYNFVPAARYTLFIARKDLNRGEGSPLFRESLRVLRKGAAAKDPWAMLALGKLAARQGDHDEEMRWLLDAASYEVRLALSRLVFLTRSREGRSHPAYIRPGDYWRIARKAYRKGDRSHTVMLEAGLSYYVDLAGEKVSLAKAEKHFLELVLDHGCCNGHTQLSALYSHHAVKLNNGKFFRPELSIAHAVVHMDHHPAWMAGHISWVYHGHRNFKRDPVRAYAAGVFCKRAGGSHHQLQLDKIKKAMTPEQLKEAEELIALKFPAGEEFRKEAREVLRKAGQLPKVDVHHH